MSNHKNPKLSEEQKAVLFDKATEAPFTGTLLENKDSGDYVCANCGQVLFNSEYKYDSHSGWPSFDRCVPGSVKFEEEGSLGMVRIEAICANCGGHLGHVFNDGPHKTTGDRFCINSLSLDFIKK